MSGTREWSAPLTPWRTVQQRFFKERGLDAEAFARKYGLNEQDVRMVLGEMLPTIYPALCDALAEETGMTPAFFAELNEQYHRHVGGARG
jgi:plasmid maintenance system antidote protein VapI